MADVLAALSRHRHQHQHYHLLLPLYLCYIRVIKKCAVLFVSPTAQVARHCKSLRHLRPQFFSLTSGAESFLHARAGSSVGAAAIAWRRCNTGQQARSRDESHHSSYVRSQTNQSRAAAATLDSSRVSGSSSGAAVGILAKISDIQACCRARLRDGCFMRDRRHIQTEMCASVYIYIYRN